jgi:D-xylose 1-dehydrogenase (NADP+, D-xylono-1,5-lactone-forming)
MTMDKVKWGILGVAKINERWLPGFRLAANAELAAIASRDAAKAKTAAQQAGIPKSYGRYEDLLADPSVEAVYLPLPNALHGEWTRRAADAGKHILCEKPLAPTATEAAEIVDYCRKKGVRLMDGFMWPHHARTTRIRQTIDSGAIGDVVSAAGTFTFLLNLTAPNIRLQSALSGGSLLDVGCYPVAGIRWAMRAEPVRVYATATLKGGVDLDMKGLLFFADGRSAMFDCGFTAPLRQWFEIVGTHGVISVQDMWLPDSRGRLFVQHGEQDLEYFDVGGRDQIACMIEEFGRAIREKREPRPSPDEAVKTLKVLDALARSARDGQIVDV